MIKFVLGEAPKIGDEFFFSFDDTIHGLEAEVKEVFSFLCFNFAICKLKETLNEK